MSEPTQTCTTCGDVESVRPDGRGFPPDIAKQRLAKRCQESGHLSTPAYRAGVRVGGPVIGQSAASPVPETQ